MNRANYLGAPAFFNLNHACQALSAAFGVSVYLVGSSMERRDYRDVDVRAIIDDEEWERLFPGERGGGSPSRNALWSIVCASISEWLSSRTGLPIDFQIQQRTKANLEYPDKLRCALGLFYPPTQKKEIPNA